MATITEFSRTTSHIHPRETINQQQEGKNEKKKVKWYQFETRISPKRFLLAAPIQIMFIYYIFMFPYRQYPILVLWSLCTTWTAVFGVTAGIHRHWSHRSYKATLPIRILLAILYASAGQMKIQTWVKLHRVHHKNSDTDGDPHNVKRGFFFSQIGWIFLAQKPEVTEACKKINIDDILADPVVRFFDNNIFLMWALFFGIIPSIIPWYFFNQPLLWSVISQFFLRYPLTIHIAGFVNSIGHSYGYHTYDKNIAASDNFLNSLITLGEGWHNYHHIFPWDYRTSEFGSFLFNPTTVILNSWAKLGLIYDLKYASAEHIKTIRVKKGDDSTIFDIYRNIDKALL